MHSNCSMGAGEVRVALGPKAKTKPPVLLQGEGAAAEIPRSGTITQALDGGRSCAELLSPCRDRGTQCLHRCLPAVSELIKEKTRGHARAKGEQRLGFLTFPRAHIGHYLQTWPRRTGGTGECSLLLNLSRKNDKTQLKTKSSIYGKITVEEILYTENR